MRKYIISILLATALILTGCKDIESANKNDKKDGGNKTSEQTNTKGYPVKIKTYGLKDEQLEQKFEKMPEKVLCASLSSAELLLELDRGDKIVGMIKRDNPANGKWKAQIAKIPEIISKRQVNMENILKSSPDLVITKKDMLDWFDISIKNLNRDGVNVYSQLASIRKDETNLKMVIDDVRNLGKIFNSNDKAEKLAKELETKLEKIEIMSKKITKEQTVLNVFNLKNNGFMSFDMSSGFHKNLLGLAKLKPVKPEGKTYTYENLVALNPDVILMVVADTAEWDTANKEDALKTITNEPAFQSVNAIKNKKIFVIDYDNYLEFGIRSFDAAEDLIKKISGESK